MLRSQISKFHDEQAIKILDKEGNVSKKNGAALLYFDIENKETLLKNKKVRFALVLATPFNSNSDV